MTRVATILLASLAAACFSEGATGPSSCPEGTRGCPCYADDSCDAALECSMDACIVPGCTPGENDCNCHEGMCFGALVCEANACHEPEAESQASATESPSTTAIASTETGSSAATILDTGTTEPASCTDEGECASCRACADAEQCAEELAACQGDDSCRALFECTEMCEPSNEACIADCAMGGGAGVALFQPFAICRACQCPTCGVACT